MLKGQALGDALVMHGDKTERLGEGENGGLLHLCTRELSLVFLLWETQT